MRWIETDTSTNGNRWTLENALCIPVSLAIDAEENRCRIRIGDHKSEAYGHSLTEAKALVRETLLGYLSSIAFDANRLRD